MTVEDMLARMSSEELSEWMAFDRLEPIGWARVDLVGGLLCSLLANQHRKRGSKAFKPGDFMPFLERGTIDVSDPDALAAAFGSLLKKSPR